MVKGVNSRLQLRYAFTFHHCNKDDWQENTIIVPDRFELPSSTRSSEGRFGCFEVWVLGSLFPPSKLPLFLSSFSSLFTTLLTSTIARPSWERRSDKGRINVRRRCLKPPASSSTPWIGVQNGVEVYILYINIYIVKII